MLHIKHLPWALVAAATVLGRSGEAAPGDLESALRGIRGVGPAGAGQAEATAAWRVLGDAQPEQLPLLLAGMDGANPLAANWIRAAVDKVAGATAAEPRRLPAEALAEFLLDPSHDARARRLAFELLGRVDSATSARLLPGFLNDPSLELRRDAVQRLIDEASALLAVTNRTGAAILSRQALGFARDVDQIEMLTKRLRELGQRVDVADLFGFLLSWKVIGPFDNSNRAGFARVFPPEEKLDLKVELEGKAGPVRWTALVTTNEYGMVDINKAYGELKEVTAYAYTEFVAGRDQPAELRLGCKNGWKVWLNGQFLFGRDEYHAGAEIDQYRLPVQLLAGRNTILVKVCQNEQKEDWTREWEFQLRLCDSLGTAIRPAKNDAASKLATARVFEGRQP